MLAPLDIEKRERMRALCRAAGGAGTAEGWRVLWTEKLTMWDLGQQTPVLLEEVTREAAAGRLPREGASALVPGCGAAYDVAALAAFFPRVVGCDIVEEAVARGREVVAGAAGAEVVQADFFAAPAGGPLAGTFGFIFDYTFFCAIPPALRAPWGARMAALLAPGGRLLTLAFPLASDEAAADPAAPGPPHPVSVAEYRKALEPHGVEMEGEPRESPASVRKELVIWWRRKA